MYQEISETIQKANSIVVIQAENPDGDSLGSALALEEILGDLGKNVSLYCPVEMPKYLRYFSGWDRVVNEFDQSADIAIIVDTSADVLLTKVLETRGVRHFLDSHEVLVLDHHMTKSTLTFDHTPVIEEVAATSHIIMNIALKNDWNVNEQAAEHLLGSLLSDTLGLSTQNVNRETYLIAAEMAKCGAKASSIESRRREFMKKSQEILHFKGELIGRIEYFAGGKLAVVHIPWEDIQAYSDQYNPSVLVLDEMRLVEGVEIAVALKTYPDGKLTGKLRSNIAISETVAGYFGGGGHPYAAGFRVYDQYDVVLKELVTATEKALAELPDSEK